MDFVLIYIPCNCGNGGDVASLEISRSTGSADDFLLDGHFPLWQGFLSSCSSASWFVRCRNAFGVVAFI